MCARIAKIAVICLHNASIKPKCALVGLFSAEACAEICIKTVRDLVFRTCEAYEKIKRSNIHGI